MHYPETPETASKYALSALKRMKEEGIAANPRNFTIWCEYFAGKNDNLKKSVDALKAEHKAISETDYHDLYDRFISAGAASARDQKLSDQIEVVTERIIAAMSATGEGTEQFGEALQEFSGGIQKADNIDQIRGMVSDIIEETETMDERSRALQQQVQESASEISSLRQELRDSRRDALTDGLTGVANRKCFDQSLYQAIGYALESGDSLSLVFADLDHFKAFNDTHGHQLGDQVLKLVGKTLHDLVKGKDTAARYGGEEFAIILPDTTSGGATAVAENIRKSVASKRIVKKGSDDSIGNITMSMGVTSYQTGESAAEFVERADQALYLAKKLGRNRVVCEDKKPEIAAVGG